MKKYYSTSQSLLLLCLSWEKVEFRTYKFLPQSYYNNIEGVCNLNIFFIYEATPSYLKSDLLQGTSTVLKLQLL